jgi:hypothetical protein
MQSMSPCSRYASSDAPESRGLENKDNIKKREVQTFPAPTVSVSKYGDLPYTLTHLLPPFPPSPITTLFHLRLQLASTNHVDQGMSLSVRVGMRANKQIVDGAPKSPDVHSMIVGHHAGNVVSLWAPVSV